jgi:integrase
MGAAWQEHDLVFCTSLGTPLNSNRALELFKRLLKKAGLPDIRLHDLRHSIATILLSMGIHPKEAIEFVKPLVQAIPNTRAVKGR